MWRKSSRSGACVFSLRGAPVMNARMLQPQGQGDQERPLGHGVSPGKWPSNLWVTERQQSSTQAGGWMLLSMVHIAATPAAATLYHRIISSSTVLTVALYQQNSAITSC